MWSKKCAIRVNNPPVVGKIEDVWKGKCENINNGLGRKPVNCHPLQERAARPRLPLQKWKQPLRDVNDGGHQQYRYCRFVGILKY